MDIVRRFTIYRLLFIVVISIPAILLMSTTSTPLFPQFNSDVAIYTLIGKGWTNGIIPFRDLFDHKGPIVFLIYAIALSLGIGKWGIFIFQLLSAVISFELIYRIGKQLGINWEWNIFAAIIAMISYFCYLDGGGTVEEWSLPFQLWPLLIFMRYSNNSFKNLKSAAFLIGICFGVVAMIRINNNCTICGIVIGMIIYFIREKRYKEILTCAIYFIIGLAIAIIPFLIYFAYYDALYEMLYATFIYNWLYKGAWGASKFQATLVMLLPCFALPVTAYFFDRKKHTHYFITFTLISIITFATFTHGRDYGHYFMMVVPITALAMQQSVCLKKWQIVLVVIYLLYPAYMFRNRPAKYYNNIVEMRHQARNTQYGSNISDEIANVIPFNERNSIYIYGLLNLSGVLCDIENTPAGKYFFFQDRFIKVDPLIKGKIKEAFIRSNPKWILATSDIKKEELFKGMLDNYVIMNDENESKSLTKRNILILKRVD